MLRIQLTAEDAVRVRFDPAPGPLVDVASAVRSLQRREPGLLRESHRRAARDPALRPLFALYPATGHNCDFSAPRSACLDDGLAAVRAVPGARIRTDLEDLSPGWRRNRWAVGLSESDPAALDVLEKATRLFSGVVLNGLGSQLALRRKLDVARRTETLAVAGTSEMLNGLHRSIRLRGNVLEVDRPWDYDVRLAGQGIVLLPSPFLVDEVLLGVTDEAAGPVLVHYPARVLPPEGAADPLRRLLGATRSRVLYAALLGGGTTDLARRVGISPASASEHAAALRDAGLVLTVREGRRVDHRLTDLGVQLLS